MVSNSAVRQSLTHMLQSQPSEQIGVPRHVVNPADVLYYLDDREPADTEFHITVDVLQKNLCGRR